MLAIVIEFRTALARLLDTEVVNELTSSSDATELAPAYAELVRCAADEP